MTSVGLAGVGALVTAMTEALGDATDPPEVRYDRAIAAYLRTLTESPAFARALLIDVYAAGPRVLARRLELQQRFVDMATGVLEVRSSGERFLCEAVTAAVSALVTSRVGTGAAAELPALREPVMDLVRRLLRSRDEA